MQLFIIDPQTHTHNHNRLKITKVIFFFISKAKILIFIIIFSLISGCYFTQGDNLLQKIQTRFKYTSNFINIFTFGTKFSLFRTVCSTLLIWRFSRKIRWFRSLSFSPFSLAPKARHRVHRTKRLFFKLLTTKLLVVLLFYVSLMKS